MKSAALLLATAAFAGGLAVSVHAAPLSLCLSQNPDGFDPAPYLSPATFDASSQALYNRLVEFERGTTKPVPGLAEGWDISADGLEYTFHLRQGVKFHTTYFFTPTRPLNADDVVFSLTRQFDRKNPYFDYAGGSWGYFEGMSMPALLASVAKVDDATVKITLTRRDPAFLADLAMDFASIVSKEYADALLKAKRREDLNRMPIGTGPYQFVGYQPDVRINYRANPDYWRGAQPVSQLAFLIVPDAGARLKAFEDGDCQVMADPAGGDIAALKQDPAVNVMQVEALDVAYLAYNTSQKPFDDVRVRIALNQAIDRKAIVDTVYGGQAAVARSPLPASMWGHIDALPDATPDPEAAKAALAAAGVTNLSLKLWVPPVDRDYNPDPRKMADMIKADLAKAGVTVEIVTDSLGAFIKATASPGRDGVVLFGWTSDNGDPDNILGTLLGCDTVGIANRAQWCDVDFNKAILDARMVEDPAARTGLYEAAQKTFAAQAPWLTIAHSLVTVPVAKAVKNYVVDPFGHHNFEGVDLAD